MKTPHLIASFAIAATASATELKDADEVAYSWERNTYVGHAQLTRDLGLRTQTVSPPLYATWPVFISECWPAAKPPSREPLIDFFKPNPLPNNVPMPRGAKPWLYGGQTYWVLPLIPSREK